MNLLELFNIPSPSETELDYVAGKLSDPAVRKYLTYQAQVLTIQVAHMTVDTDASETTESFLRRKANAQGRLAVILELLTIQPADPQPAN